MGQLLAGLDSRFELLTSGAGPRLPRHRTLRTAIGWSHELCARWNGCCGRGFRCSPGVGAGGGRVRLLRRSAPARGGAGAAGRARGQVDRAEDRPRRRAALPDARHHHRLGAAWLDELGGRRRCDAATGTTTAGSPSAARPSGSAPARSSGPGGWPWSTPICGWRLSTASPGPTSGSPWR
ncbi:hypothetical protein NKH77_03405 [Streptomyces sp. M19]